MECLPCVVYVFNAVFVRRRQCRPATGLEALVVEVQLAVCQQKDRTPGTD